MANAQFIIQVFVYPFNEYKVTFMIVLSAFSCFTLIDVTNKLYYRTLRYSYLRYINLLLNEQTNA